MPYQGPEDRIRGDEGNDDWNIVDNGGEFEGEESIEEGGKSAKTGGTSRIGMSGGESTGQRSTGGKNGQSVTKTNGSSKKSVPAMPGKTRNPKVSPRSKGKMSGTGGRSAGTGGARGRQVAKGAAMTAKKATGSSKRSTGTTGRTTSTTASRNSAMSRGARNKGGSTRSSSGVRTSNARAAGAIKAGRR